MSLLILLFKIKISDINFKIHKWEETIHTNSIKNFSIANGKENKDINLMVDLYGKINSNPPDKYNNTPSLQIMKMIFKEKENFSHLEKTVINSLLPLISSKL